MTSTRCVYLRSPVLGSRAALTGCSPPGPGASGFPSVRKQEWKAVPGSGVHRVPGTRPPEMPSSCPQAGHAPKGPDSQGPSGSQACPAGASTVPVRMISLGQPHGAVIPQQPRTQGHRLQPRLSTGCLWPVKGFVGPHCPSNSPVATVREKAGVQPWTSLIL